LPNLPLILTTVAKEIIVIIGGPGSGKSTLIEGLLQKGYTCYPEISREVTLEARKQGIEQLFLEKPILFSELLLEGRKRQYNDALAETADMVFIDRGLPDVTAYMHYIGSGYPDFFDEACRTHKYTRVFFLPPWEDIYVADDARYENYGQATEIALHLQETYKKYGYELTEVPKDTPDNRILFILGHLSQ
jgi:predicted ATPase